MSTTRFLLIPILAAACGLALAAPVLQGQQPAPAPASATTDQPPALPTDLDAFMAKVLEKRNQNWRTLHDYILSERESFDMLGPMDIPLHSLRREFNWFIKEGYLVRSPVKSNGVAIGATERAKYEDEWLKSEREREARARKKQEKKDATREVQVSISLTGDMEVTGLASQGTEPRFISEAYFMEFKFEPGNYYFAGREHLDGREVLKIDYLPSKMFNDEPARKDKNAGTTPASSTGSSAAPGAASDTAPGTAAQNPAGSPAKDKKKPVKARSQKDVDAEARLERAMNKTSAVTMWIDPREYQIVRYRFDNVDWGFLPGRQFVRVDDARASMTMGLVFDGIWLPKDITFSGAATFAPGTLRFSYQRQFNDYRRGEVSAKIRAYTPREPQS